MSAQTLLADLAAAGIHIEARGDRLHVEASAGVMTDDLIQRLRAHKADLLAALARDLDEDAREYFEERAAIAEFDGGLSRPEAERQASGRVFEYKLAGIDQALVLLMQPGDDIEKASQWLHERYGPERVLSVRRYQRGVTRCRL